MLKTSTIFFCLCTIAQAAFQTHSCTVQSNVALGGTAWVNPGNSAVSDDSKATYTATGAGDYLKATGCNFTIPTGSTVTGFQVHTEISANDDGGGHSGRRIDWAAIALVKNNTIESATGKVPNDAWPVVETVVTTPSGTSDMWGLTFTPAEVNASDFGVAIAGIGNRVDGTEIGYVDHIYVTAYYTLPAGYGSYRMFLGGF